jgi:zona occludens toxin (predicted ATPase)
MIAIYEGKIGGGKTYLAVCRILAHLAKGGTVFTNVELRLEGVAAWMREVHGLELDPEAVRFLDESESWDFHKYLKAGREINTLCVIDEAHLWFNARDHAVTAATKRELITFLSQSRKLKVDVIFIVQAAENLDAQFRRLAQEIWRMKDLQRFRIPLVNIAYPWPHTLAFRLDNGNFQVMEKKLLRREQTIYDSYNTNALLRPVEFAGEVQGVRQLKRIDQDKPGPLSWLRSWSKWEPGQSVLASSLFVTVILWRLLYG